MIITFRPEFQEAWSGAAHVSTLVLNRLDAGQGTVLAVTVAGKALPNDVLTHIAARTDGVPLFVEELTKAVLESGMLRDEGDRHALDREIPSFAIPPSLHASLLARLDRLGPTAKEIAQIGAAIGRDFSYELLAAVARRDESELQDALGRLVDAGLVFQRGVPPKAVYLFKHSLLRDASYGTLLRGFRQQLHAHIAGALEAHSSELMDIQPELFAHHYTEAGLIERSIAFWSKAGRKSAARSAMAEAAAQYKKGLDQLALLPENPDRQRRELEIFSSLGAVLIAIKGHPAPETGHAFARARELWEQLGFPSEFLQIPYGQSAYHLNRGELDLAQRLAEDLLRLSRQRDDSAGIVLGHYSLGRALMYAGKLAQSQSNLEQVLALYDPIPLRPHLPQAGDDPLVGAQTRLGLLLFSLGFPDQALAQTNAAISEARKLAHPPSLALSLNFGARLLCFIGDTPALDERANQLLVVATEQDFPQWRAMATIWRGCVKVNHGDLAEGITLLRSGSTAYHATGARSWIPLHLALLAGAYEIAGQTDEAVTLLDDALQITGRIEKDWFLAELYRQKGRVLLRQGHTESGEDLYRKALSIAEKQEAKLWELRAAASLARLRRDQGRRAEARDLLAPVYGWFTEGFDAPDLKEAKALLDELR
jgi:predicted ATPase